MGDRGPAPRRDAERRRTNDKGKVTHLTREQLQMLPFEIDLEPAPPAVGASWPTEVRELWEALQVDPARKWMTAADWAATKLVLTLLADAMQATDDNGVAIPVNGQTQTAILKHLASIGVTEAARLRLQKEVTLFPLKKPEGDGTVTDIATRRQDAVQ